MDSIEALVPLVCPCCNEQIVVKLNVLPPEIIGVQKRSEVEDVIQKLTQREDDTTKEDRS